MPRRKFFRKCVIKEMKKGVSRKDAVIKCRKIKKEEK